MGKLFINETKKMGEIAPEIYGHVFHMYRHHQGAQLLESSLSGVGMIENGDDKVPEITESVSEKDGIITVTVCNLSVSDSKKLELQLAETKEYEVIEAMVVGDTDPHDYNTFENPDNVVEKAFDGCSRVSGNRFDLLLPPASVVELRLK